ncbi:DUF4369 domain-containing protein [Pontibacter locisalis]|uniref:DUF4369 domain-containing protein n=1 Tax=Pontibacter locisalis TaxID=1719035 RepID=A0ABW5IRF9_9BACT
MNKLLLPALVFGLLTLSYCAGKKHTSSLGSYIVSGTVKGATDGSWIYLKHNGESSLTPLLDSALVKKERFEFRGQLKNKVLQTIIGFKEPFYDADGAFKGYKLSDAAILWLENSDVRLEGEKGSLFKAKITGSATQQDFERVLTSSGDDKLLGFIRQNPNSSYLGIYLLNLNKEKFGKEVAAELFSLMTADKRDSYYGREVAAYIGREKN